MLLICLILKAEMASFKSKSFDSIGLDDEVYADEEHPFVLNTKPRNKSRCQIFLVWFNSFFCTTKTETKTETPKPIVKFSSYGEHFSQVLYSQQDSVKC
jgi:hypothetical protein